MTASEIVADPLAPSVGDAGSVCCWTDHLPVTVVEVRRNGREVVVQEDRAIRTDKNGISESQRYIFMVYPNGRKMTFTLRKNGRYHEKGCPMRHGYRLWLGRRSAYRDPCF